MMTPIGGVPVQAEFVNKARPSFKKKHFFSLYIYLFLNKDTVDTSCEVVWLKDLWVDRVLHVCGSVWCRLSLYYSESDSLRQIDNPSPGVGEK